jgi:hypothetical protein
MSLPSESKAMSSLPSINSSKNEIENAKRFQSLLSTMDATEVNLTPMLFTNRRTFSNILARTQLFMKILTIPGDVVECGVYKLNGLMTFFHVSSILEPYNVNRKIIGFDTFEGFPAVNYDFDANITEGYLSDLDFETLNKFRELQESDKLLSHVDRSLLVKGNALDTIPEYVRETPSMVIALLYLDFDTYEATKMALKHLYPLIPRGGIVAFDQLGQKKWPGETKALKEFLNISTLKLEKFSFDPHVTYFVKE